MAGYFRLISFMQQGFMTIMHIHQNFVSEAPHTASLFRGAAVAPDHSKASDKASGLSPDVSWRVCKVQCWFIVDWGAIFIVSFDGGCLMSDFVKKCPANDGHFHH